MVRLLAITPPAAIALVIGGEIVDAWLEAGALAFGLAVLLREPGADAAAILADARLGPLRQALAQRGVAALLSVDPRQLEPDEAARLLERAEPALAGVQLRGDPSPQICARWRQRLGPAAIIGRSVHGLDASPDPGPELVDYTCLAPIHAPHTRLPGDDKQRLGLDGLRRWTRARDDVLALGGVTAENAAACLAAGARGLAGIRLFFGRRAEARQDVEALCRALRRHGSLDHVPTQTRR